MEEGKGYQNRFRSIEGQRSRKAFNTVAASNGEELNTLENSLFNEVLKHSQMQRKDASSNKRIRLKKSEHNNKPQSRSRSKQRMEDTLTNNKLFADLLQECDQYIHSSQSFVPLVERKST